VVVGVALTREILAYIYRRGAVTIDELYEVFAKNRNKKTVSTYLSRFVKKGLIKRIGRGVYAPAK
jgi:predicted transcriptional regulator